MDDRRIDRSGIRATTGERRWIVVASDGRHVTLGRATDPSPDELEQAAEGLRKMGIAGWLAVSEGTYYGRGALRLMMVRSLAEVEGAAWAEAEAAFKAIRQAATGSAESPRDRPTTPD